MDTSCKRASCEDPLLAGNVHAGNDMRENLLRAFLSTAGIVHAWLADGVEFITTHPAAAMAVRFVDLLSRCGDGLKCGIVLLPSSEPCRVCVKITYSMP